MPVANSPVLFERLCNMRWQLYSTPNKQRKSRYTQPVETFREVWKRAEYLTPPERPTCGTDENLWVDNNRGLSHIKLRSPCSRRWRWKLGTPNPAGPHRNSSIWAEWSVTEHTMQYRLGNMRWLERISGHGHCITPNRQWECRPFYIGIDWNPFKYCLIISDFEFYLRLHWLYSSWWSITNETVKFNRCEIVLTNETSIPSMLRFCLWWNVKGALFWIRMFRVVFWCLFLRR